MKFWVGTSGFSYKEWKGPFYPEDLLQKEMLRFYGENLPSVEINNTFYRMPKAEMLEGWAGQVPDDFRFVLKATRKITHFKKLQDCGEEAEYLFRTAKALGNRLGVILFQLPPYLHKNLELLETFLELLPDDANSTFEFRHHSWFEDDVYERLRNHGCALCVADTDGEEVKRVVSTADWGYLRLRRPDYTEADLEEWSKLISSQNWQQVFVFFKHEDGGAGPKLAKRFMQISE